MVIELKPGMEKTIGFVLLTHKNPNQVKRLVNTLNKLFCNPPISIHHDQSKSDLDITNDAGERVSIVKDYVVTDWGRISVIDGAIKAFKGMRDSTGLPDWIFLLSESCYPIANSTAFYEHLEAAEHDAYIHYELTDINNIKREWNKLCWNRYCNHRDSPFNSLHPCYAGEHWFHANRKSIEYLINHYDRNPLLRQYYAKCEIPEESYYQTVLANNYSLSLANNHMRFIDWEGQGAHPKTLHCGDISRIVDSGCLIARKFDTTFDQNILDLLDERIGII